MKPKERAEALAWVFLVHGREAAGALRECDPEAFEQLAIAALDPAFVAAKLKVLKDERHPDSK